MSRKHKHEPRFTKKGGDWYDSSGNYMPPPMRRAHGILAHVREDTLALASAAKRAWLYMHSAARKRHDPERWRA